MTFFSITSFIECKRLKRTHPPGEISKFIQLYHEEKVEDYQMSAWMMAVNINTNTPTETAELTQAMIMTGVIADYTDLFPPSTRLVDKHSTGGVGDKTSLILAPLLACCGVPVPMMSGRGLGHTGGTLDKLESIHGFNVYLDMPEFKKILKTVGCAMVAAGKTMAPVDKRMYALRDVTSTVPSLSLITGSIMCKKLAENPHGLVLDVKCGKGAFMKTTEDAIDLAKSMVSTGTKNNKKTVALITTMDEPLGAAVGNFFEVYECVKIMKNEYDHRLCHDLVELTLMLAGMMCVNGEVCATLSEGVGMARRELECGNCLSKFYEMVGAQNGDVACVKENLENYEKSKFSSPVRVTPSQFVTSIDALEIGHTCVDLGAGRKVSSDSVLMNTGVIMNVKVGQQVGEDGVIATVYGNDEKVVGACVERVKNAFLFGELCEAQCAGEKFGGVTHIVTVEGVKKFQGLEC